MDLFYSIQYPVHANITKLTVATTTTRVSASSTSTDSSSHARSLVAATAPERSTRYYFRNLEEDMELVASGIAGHQKEGIPPKTHSAFLEDTIDTLGMSSSFADDDSSSDDSSSRMANGRGDEHHRHDSRSRMQISPPLSASSSSSSFGSSMGQYSEEKGHARLRVMDRAQFLVD